MVSGKGRHLGINIQWSIRWRGDGAFYEEISGKELGFKWGYDGGVHSSCWEMDSSGVARSLECDDHEALLLGAWVRTGVWLHPHITDRLDLELVSSQPKAGSGKRKTPDRSSSTSSRSKSSGNDAGTSSSSSRSRSRSPPPPGVPLGPRGKPLKAQHTGTLVRDHVSHVGTGVSQCVMHVFTLVCEHVMHWACWLHLFPCIHIIDSRCIMQQHK